MSWADIFKTNAFSVALAPQATDINTAGSSWTWINCDFPQLSYEPSQTDTKRSRQARGAGSVRGTGKVWPRLAIKFPLHGQLSTYAYASDTPSMVGAMRLLDWLGGTAGIAYQAAGINSTDGNTMSLVTSQGKVGCLIAARESSGAVQAMGFAKTIGSGGPYSTDLFEDLAALPGASTGRLPTYTIYPSSTQPQPLTVRVTGEAASQDRRFIGGFPKKITLAPDQDDRWYATCELIFYGGENRAGGAGGFQTQLDYLAMEPQLGRGNSRWVLGSNVFTSFNDATVDPDGTCDVRDPEIVIEFDHYVSRVGTKSQGVKEVILGQPTITTSLTVPDISDFEVSTEHFGEKAWRDLTQVSCSLYMGDTPGRLFAYNMPRGNITVWPDPVVVDDALHRRISLEAGPYSGDAASTDAGNKSVRIAVG